MTFERKVFAIGLLIEGIAAIRAVAYYRANPNG